MKPDVCPNCGAEVPRDARACPECGSDEQTGWSEQARTDGLDLPDPEFNYQEFAEREFGQKKIVPRGLHWFWWVMGVAVLLAFLFLLLR